MGAHIKTTIDLADPLFHAAKELAIQQQTTLRALVEEGLRLVLQQRNSNPVEAFKLRDARFDGGQTVWPESHEWRDLETHHLIGNLGLLDKR
jgi:hypothetical protein